MVYPSTSTSTAPGFIAVPGTVMFEQPPKDFQQPLEDFAMEILRKENTFKINSGIRMTEAILNLADGALKPTAPQKLTSFQYQEASERTNTLDKNTKVIHRRLKEIAVERKSMEEIVNKMRNVSARSEATVLAWKIANSDVPDPEDILLLDKITKLLRLEDEQEQLLEELRRKNKAMENVLNSADDILLTCPWFRSSLDADPRSSKKKNVCFNLLTEVKPFISSDEARKVRLISTYTIPTFKDEEQKSSLQIFSELGSMKKEEESIPFAFKRLANEASLTLIAEDSSEELHVGSSESSTSNLSVTDSDKSSDDQSNEIIQRSSIAETENIIPTSINEGSNANGKNRKYKEKQVSKVEIPNKQNQRDQTNDMPQISIESLENIENNVGNEIQTNKTSETSNVYLTSCESETCENANVDNKTGNPSKEDNLEITKIDNNPDKVNEVTNFCLGGNENLSTSESETSNMNISNIQNRESNEKGNLDVKRIENESSYGDLVQNEDQTIENFKNLKEAAGTVNQTYTGVESNQLITANEHSSNANSTSLAEINYENHAEHISLTDGVIIPTNAVLSSNVIKSSDEEIMSTNEKQQSNLNETSPVKITPNEHQSSDVNKTDHVTISTNESQPSNLNETSPVKITPNEHQSSDVNKTDHVTISTNESQPSNLNETSPVKITPNEHQSSDVNKTDHAISTNESQPSSTNRASCSKNTTNENQPGDTSKSHVKITTTTHETQPSDVDEADSLIHARCENQAEKNNLEITNNVDYTNQNSSREKSVEGYASNENHNCDVCDESRVVRVFSESQITIVSNEGDSTNEDQDSTASKLTNTK